MKENWVVFASPALGSEGHVVRALEGADALNELFRMRARVEHVGGVSSDDLAALLAAPARLTFVEDGRTIGEYCGVVSEASAEADLEFDKADLHVELVPRAWALTQRRGSEIFLERSVVEVISMKLEAIGLVAGVDFVMALADKYPGREFIAQYEETDYAFVSRLCEQHGITTFFEHRDERDVFVFTDSGRVFHDIARSPLHVRRRVTHPAAYGVRTTLRRTATKAEVHDYNYRNPILHLGRAEEVDRPATIGEWIEYGPHPKTIDDTARTARLRAEELGVPHHTVQGYSTEQGLRAGATFRLTDQGGAEQELLATRIEFKFRRQGESNAPADDSTLVAWENRFEAIPRDVPFRPARKTPWPKIPGLVNAIVDGAIRGDYAELDESGRYRVRMMYDRSGRTDLGATHPMRMMQPHSGAYYGMHFPLRPGAEVLVGFVNGDPDRPVIVGAAPNPLTSSPVQLSNQTQNVLRSGGNNEIVMEDFRGTERIRVHSPHEDTTLQLGAMEEAEEGALITTKANISLAAHDTINAVTTRATVVADGTTAFVGRYAATAVGSRAVSAATEKGAEEPTNFSFKDIARDLKLLSVRPEERANALAAAENEEEAKSDDESANEAGGLYSGVGAAVTDLTREAVLALARAVAATTDNGLDAAMGRLQGEPLGEPLEPAAITAADQTAALIGRDVGFVFGDRSAAVSSLGTASLMGREVALLKSTRDVEIAAGERLYATTAGTLDIAAGLARLVAGYYPDAEAPPLDESVTLGIMSRHDLRVHSVEDCIIFCAQKHLIGSAHTGDVRWTAAKTVHLSGGTILGTAGNIKFDASKGKFEAIATGNIELTTNADCIIKAANVVRIKAPTVIIEADNIKLDGHVDVTKGLHVSGGFTQG